MMDWFFVGFGFGMLWLSICWFDICDFLVDLICVVLRLIVWICCCLLVLFAYVFFGLLDVCCWFMTDASFGFLFYRLIVSSRLDWF